MSKKNIQAPISTGAFTYAMLNSLPPSDSLGNNDATAMPRSPSYHSSVSSTSLRSNIVVFVRHNARAVAATIAFFCFVFVLSLDVFQPTKDNASGYYHGGLRSKSSTDAYFPHLGGAVHSGYFLPSQSVIDSNTFHFAAVTDLDQLSRDPFSTNKLLFRSFLLSGILYYDGAKNSYSVRLEKARTLVSGHNEAGRGMELSELTNFQNRLYSFDDRTGSVFEILSEDSGNKSYVVPRFVITEGEGDTDKGMKWEWATVKGKQLYMGSMGKEFTNKDGSVANVNNMWIAIMNEYGEVTREDWTAQYNFVREALGASSPGYIINEAILWSDELKRWVFLPRRVSNTRYDENEDERKGSNKLVLVDEHFKQSTIVDIKLQKLDPLHGFSSFAFVPNTKDRHAMAIRSVEEDCVGGEESVCQQRSFLIVFDVLSGEILMDEFPLSEDQKFEGLEFVNIYTPEPE